LWEKLCVCGRIGEEDFQGAGEMRFLGRLFLLTMLCFVLFVPMVSAQEGRFTLTSDSQLASGVGDSRFSPYNNSSSLAYPNTYIYVDVVDYTADVTDPSACTSYKNSLWITFTSPYTGKVMIDTYYSQFDTVVAAFRTAPTSANMVACNNDAPGRTTSVASFAVRAGETYYVMAGAASGAAITADNDYLDVSFITNDYYKNGYVIPPGSSSYVRVQNDTQYSGVGADWTFPCLAVPTGFNHAVWHKFTPATTAYYTFTTNGSNYDTVLGVYRNGSSLTSVGCNNNYGTGRTSRVRVRLTAGTIYYIQVGRFGAASTTSSLSTRLAMTRG
jgi:hypothetical protein